MIFTTNYKLEKFIIDAKWEKLPSDVKERLRGCLIDLLGALLSGTKSEQFEVGLRIAKKTFGLGEVAVIGSKERFSPIGAATPIIPCSPIKTVETERTKI